MTNRLTETMQITCPYVGPTRMRCDDATRRLSGKLSRLSRARVICGWALGTYEPQSSSITLTVLYGTGAYTDVRLCLQINSAKR
jgi:hypothetical protein